MPLTPEDIISSLVSYYKRSGVDMTALLGDPTWQAMKVADKIEAIKAHAADIHSGSTDNLTASDKKRFTTNAILNAWPVVPAVAMLALNGPIMKVLPGVQGRTLMHVGLGGVAVGLGVGALQAYMQSKQTQEYRQALRANLENVVRNPTTTNAVGVLATDNLRRENFSVIDAVRQRVQRELSENFHPGDWVDNKYKKQIVLNNDVAMTAHNFATAQANHPN